MDNVPCSEGRQAAVHQAQKRVSGATRQTRVRHVDRDRVGEGLGASGQQGDRVGRRFADIETQGGGTGTGAKTQGVQVQRGAGSIEQGQRRAAGYHHGGDEARIREFTGQRQRGIARGAQGGDGRDLAGDGERAAFTGDSSFIAHGDRSAEGHRGIAGLDDVQITSARVLDGIITGARTKSYGGIIGAKTEGGGGRRGVVNDHRAVRDGRERVDGLSGSVQIHRGGIRGGHFRADD